MEYPWQFTGHIAIIVCFVWAFVKVTEIQESVQKKSHRTIAMVDEYVHNNLRDLVEE
jgi:hypothetical protein